METIAPYAPLSRCRDDRIFAGVCAGVGEHVKVDALWVRGAAVALTAFFGLGALIYAVLWILMPANGGPGESHGGPGESHGGPGERVSPPPLAHAPVDAAREDSSGRGVAKLKVDRTPGRWRYLGVALALVSAVIGISMIAGVRSTAAAWGTAGVVALVGAGLSWNQLAEESDDGVAPETRGRVWFGIGAGWVIATFALVAALARGRAVGDVIWAVFAGAVLLTVTALILLPVGLRLWRSLGAERTARAREAERADIAAHLHDSVLQTLALIRARSHDAAAVTALARSQERELRQWLYSDPTTAGGSMARLIEDIGASIEESWEVPIEVVTVGDGEPTSDAFQALLAATREALTNAARHAGTDVRLFAEFTPAQVEVFVRDRGPGFDPAAIPEDRRGVRDSIHRRMRRHGGHAHIHASTEGTEVHLVLRTPPSNQSAGEGEGE